MNRNRVVNRWVAIGVFVVAILAYLRTIAPDVSFWDCGEFIAASFTMGIMHPPGAPLFTIIGRLFTFFPIHNVAWRVNVISVISSALTITLLYLIIVRLTNIWRGQPKNAMDRWIVYGGAVIGALAFAFSDSFWFNAVEAEVYAMSMLFTALAVWIVLYWKDNPVRPGNERWLILIVYLLWLSTGVHLLNLLVFPFIFIVIVFENNLSMKRLVWVVLLQAGIPLTLYILFFHYNPSTMSYQQFIAHQNTAWKFFEVTFLIVLVGSLYYLYKVDRKAFKMWWIVPLLFIIGYSTYILIYIRSSMNPPIDENDPDTWAALKNYLARKQYGENSLLLTIFARKAPFWQYQINKMFVRYFSWQFIGTGTTIGKDGYISEIISLRGLYGLPFLVGIIGAVHHFTKDWKRGLAVLFLFFMMGLAIVFYVNQENPQPRERDYSYVGSFFAFAIWIGIGAVAVMDAVSEFLKKHKAILKPALLVSLLALAFAIPINMFAFNFYSHDRSGNYVPYDYSYNILQTCEPNGIIFTNGDNDTFPLWYLQYVKNIRTDVRLVNLSLLNTPWYIKQLKYRQPKVPISLQDKFINNIGLYPWPKAQTVEINVPDSVYNDEIAEMKKYHEMPKKPLNTSGKIEFIVKPTVAKRALRVQDIMVLNIMMADNWRKPIYFAVTVSDKNKVGLNPYLRMDGMAFRVIPFKGIEISAHRLRENLFHKFLFRNLNNPKVYLDYKTKGLLINYRSAFLRLAAYYRMKKKMKDVIEVLNRMEYLMPEKLIPIHDDRVVLSIGKMYWDAGEPGEFEKRAKAIIQKHPNSVEAYVWLLDYYRSFKRYTDGIELMQKWLQGHPNDRQAQDIIRNLRRQLAKTGTDSIMGSTGVIPVQPKK
ncbi:hypothetical protein BMS3Abin05_02752 [bacterium BMS3Abin05]|nr:hypothetical protein BMS3Abin05_02752 [bacterium BMS3Abin05]GBE26177.1 hypothetical protein BMS3Bbin03_00088 [bacterium BMS3Bbin03]